MDLRHHVRTATRRRRPPFALLLVLGVLLSIASALSLVRAATLLTTIPLSDVQPLVAAVDSGRQRAYVTAANPDTLIVIDTTTDAILERVPLDNYVFGLAVNSSTGHVYLANYHANTVTVLDGETTTVIDTISGNFNQPQLIAINETTNRVYVTNDKGGGQLNPSFVTVIDGATNTIVGSIPVGSSPHGIAVNPVDNQIYISAAGNDPGLTIVDGTTDTVVTTIPLAVSVSGIGIDTTLNRIYIADSFGNRVSVVDGASATVTHIDSTPFPVSIAVDSVRHRAYVSNQGDLGGFGSVVSVIDTSTNTLVEQVRVGAGALMNLLDVDPATAKVYVPLINARAVAVIGPETPINQPPFIRSATASPILEGGSATLIVDAVDPDDDPLTFQTDCDDDGAFETLGLVCDAQFFPDNGAFTVNVQVDDGRGGRDQADVTIQVANAAPTIEAIHAPTEPISVNTTIATLATFTDPGVLDIHTASWAWGDETASPGVVTESGGAGTVAGSHTYTRAGVYTVQLQVTDKDGGSDEQPYQYVVVYDPSAGFVTGSGVIASPAGASTADPTLSGRATFGFVSRYERGATVPSGMTEFAFQLADLRFRSSSYAWLVVAGSRAQFKGTGTINDQGSYGFMITAVDGGPGNRGGDRFRIKIWDRDTDDAVVYDNQVACSDTTDAALPCTGLLGGNIVIHR
jgi:YVTN family beta-propeller protein